MKVRQGFVSNSSSSSFIIEGTWIRHPRSGRDENITIESVKKYVYKTMRQWRNKGVRNAEKYITSRPYYKDLTKKELHDKIEHEKNYYEYRNDKTLDKEISIKPFKKAKKDLEGWYDSRVLSKIDTVRGTEAIVIQDHSDNFIPETVAKKIIKHYDISEDEYNLHMG